VANLLVDHDQLILQFLEPMELVDLVLSPFRKALGLGKVSVTVLPATFRVRNCAKKKKTAIAELLRRTPEIGQTVDHHLAVALG